ncbi:hypothetical protein F5884DRAFT_296783 [Xylogone sp. PMI_703]|nr:hypothetical protein F5884DRAFT_296783 [Xylogone sp. PMI_703]
MDTKAEAYDKRMEGVFYLPEIPIVPQYLHSPSPEKMNSVQQAFLGLHVNEISHEAKPLGSTTVSNQEVLSTDLSGEGQQGLAKSLLRSGASTIVRNQAKNKPLWTVSGFKPRPKADRKTMAHIWQEKLQQYAARKRQLEERAKRYAWREQYLEQHEAALQADRDRKWAQRKAMGEPESITGYKGTAFLRPARPISKRSSTRGSASASPSLSAADGAASSRSPSIGAGPDIISAALARGIKRRREESPESADE